MLSVDRARLADAAGKLLGFPSGDADGYLRRFIDFNFSLPEPNGEAYCRYIAGHIGLDLEHYGGHQAIARFAHFSASLDLSLRVQMQCLIRLKLVMQSLSGIQGVLGLMMPCLMAFDAKYPRVIHSCFMGHSSAIRVIGICEAISKTGSRDQVMAAGDLAGAVVGLFRWKDAAIREIPLELKDSEEADQKQSGGWNPDLYEKRLAIYRNQVRIRMSFVEDKVDK